MNRRAAVGVEGLRPGQHFCWSYGDPIAFRSGLARFVSDGLARGERVVCHLASDRLGDITSALYQDVASAGPAEAAGALRMLSARDTYLVDGRFEPQRRLADVEELTQRALADGYTALRSLLQPSDFKDNASAVSEWPSCELRSDFFVARRPVTLVCAYDAAVCRENMIAVLRGVHPFRSSGFLDEPAFGMHAGRLGELLVHGEIDFVNSDTVGTLGSIAAADVVRPMIDLSRLRFADLSGMRALGRIVQAMQAAHGRVHISGASPTIQKVWHLLELSCDPDVSFSARSEQIQAELPTPDAINCP